MGNIYIVPDMLLSVAAEIYRTLTGDCEKNVRIEVDPQASFPQWFRVEEDPNRAQAGSLRVKGMLGAHRYTLYADPVSARFEAEDERLDMEQLFYLFIQMIESYRNKRRLPPLNTQFIYGFAKEDSPLVNAENYGEVPPDTTINKLGIFIGEYFYGKSFNEWHGRFSYYICMEPCEVYLELKYVRVYRELLKSFEAAFPAKYVRLFAVRWTGRQYLFFVSGEGRVYCAKHDGIREFLNEHFEYIYKVLSISPFKALNRLSEVPKLPGGAPLAVGIPGASGVSFRFTLEED